MELYEVAAINAYTFHKNPDVTISIVIAYVMRAHISHKEWNSLWWLFVIVVVVLHRHLQLKFYLAENIRKRMRQDESKK